ncbi:MAG: hypothetical protein ACLGI5_14095 [Thermoleophilia bacterium]
MHRTPVALVVLVLAGLVAAGCGSDDPEPSSDSSPEAAQVETAKPKTKSVRQQMVDCIENDLGFDVTPGDDPDRLSVESPDDELQAVIVIHPDAGAARKAVGRTLSSGMNAVVFGRAEFIRRAAGDTESGVIANCVALQYNRPRRG